MNEVISAPFGNPDGARASITQMNDGFIPFLNSAIWGGIATRKDDFTARVIVGRKGAGKTIYLRRIQDAATQDNSLYADEIQQNLPNTTHIITFSHWFKGMSQ